MNTHQVRKSYFDLTFVVDSLDMQEIIPGLYLGGVTPTSDKEKLAQIGINHVLSVGTQPL